MSGAVSFSAILYWICSTAYAGLCVVLATQTRRERADLWLVGACAVTALWAAAYAVTFPVITGPIADLADLARSMAWYGFVLYLFRRSIVSGGMVARMFGTMGLLALLIFGLVIMLTSRTPLSEGSAWSAIVVARLGIAVCAVLLIENLWRNTEPTARWHVNLACIGLGALFVYDIAFQSDTILTRTVSPTLFAGRAVASVLVVPLLALAALRNRDWRIDVHLSRTVAFHSATLIVSGIFFLSLAAAGELLRRFDADWGAVAEVSLIFAGFLVVGTFVTSGSARSWIRSAVVDHFFTHRYDYRREWLRCTATLAAPDTFVPLHVRAIRAVAEIVDSPGGVLFLRGAEEQAFQWAGSWNMQALTHPVMSDHPLVGRFHAGEAAVELATMAAHEGASVREALAGAWLAVPIGQPRRQLGFVLLAPPRAAFRLDREVFELLRTVSGMVASLIAEQQLTEVLTQTRQLHEYGKRFAFVAHDIKNISSQLSLLLANAEIHMQNPEFQHDMLETVRSSVHKIGILLRRLRTPEPDLADTVMTPAERITRLVASCQRSSGVTIALEDDGLSGDVAINPSSFDAVVAHLLDNAIDASAPGAHIRVRLRHEMRRLLIDIVDRGSGMTPEFVRDELFRPFGTSKRDGTGIGAFQARELLRAAGGDLLVMSEIGVGTTMRLLLPLLNTVELEAAPRIA